MVPEGATPLDPAGTAPGLVVPTDGPVIVVLPGPPRELQEMWPAALETGDVARGGLPGRRRTGPRRADVRHPRVGAGEDACARSSEDVDLAPLEITTCLRRAELEIDVRYREGAEPACAAAHGRSLAARLPIRVQHGTGPSIDQQIARAARGQRIGLAESCTAGLLAARLTEIPGLVGLRRRAAWSPTRTRPRCDLLGVPAS